MAYTKDKLSFYMAGQMYRELNPEKYKYLNSAAQYRYKAKHEFNKVKRQHYLDKAAEYQAKADACGPSIKPSEIFPKMPKY